MPLVVEELAWFEEAQEKVLGVLVRDLSDNDYACYILGRDARLRFRAVWIECSIATIEDATALLQRKIAEYSQMAPEALYQGDEVGAPVDFFAPVVAEPRRHPIFRSLLANRGYSPALGLIREMMRYFQDADGNFVQQFQSDGFDPRLWELYLYALFTELGYGFDRAHPRPDFHCQGLRGDFCVEATTVNPSAENPEIDDSNRQAYFEQYVPMKFGSALYSKLKPRYWDLPHVTGRPLALAIQDFHAPHSMAWSSSALVEYLYGIRQVERTDANRKSEIVSERIESYKWGEKEVGAGFFFHQGVEHISAVIANPSATVSKFNRMGFIAGFGDRDVRMVRKGLCYREKPTSEEFVAEVHAPGYSETWVEGVSVYHNPNAIFAMPQAAIPGAAHHSYRRGRIWGRMPQFYPVGSTTIILTPEQS